MKGLLAFDQMNDIVFIKLDLDLEKHLSNVAIKQGLIASVQNQDNNRPPGGSESELGASNSHQRWPDSTNQITSNIIVQLFSPLLTSQYIMQNQFHNAYSSVVCDDGLRITFYLFSGHHFLCISLDDEESEVLAARRLKVFVKLVNMLYGISLLALKTEFLSGTDPRPKLLSSLVNKWEKLRMEDQSFLVEAIERVLVNRNLSLICIKQLEHANDSMRRMLSAPYTACHSFILIGTKLLSFYSSRNASVLNPSDVLLLTILANTAHSQDKKLKHVGVTASLRLSRESLKSDKSVDYNSGSKSDTSKFSRFKRSASFIRKKYTPQPKDTSLKRINSHMDISYHLLFLQTSHGVAVPHVVYNIRIASGMVLVIVCEAGKGLLSKCLVNSMDILLAVKTEQIGTKSREIAAVLHNSLHRMFSIISNYKLNSDAQRTVKIAGAKWEQLMRLNFLEYLKNTDQYQMSARMEAAASSFCDSLRELFHQLIYLPELTCEKFVQTFVQQTLLVIQKEMKTKLSDYIDYLLVKSMQNITMTTYAQDYPGLLHFIYVDRSNNFVLAPFINKDSVVLSDQAADPEMDLATINRDKIWSLFEFTQKQIHLGHTSVMWKDDTHYCTYFLWFEDRMGNSLSPKKTSINLSQMPLPGILNGNFYTKYTQECFPDEPPGNIHCYELLCIHVGATSVAFVINFCRRLAAQLYEISGNTASPLTIT